MALLAGCMGFAFSGIVGFLTPYTRQIGLLETSKYFFLVYAATILVSRPFTGRRADRKGPDAVLYPAVFLFAIGLCLLGFVDRASSVLFAGLLIGLGYGSFTPVAQVVAVRRAPLERVGLATSTFFAIFDVGAGLGYFLLGSLVPLLGLSGLFPCMAAFVLAGLCVFGYFQTRRKRFRIWRLYRNWKDWALNLRPSPEQ